MVLKCKATRYNDKREQADFIIPHLPYMEVGMRGCVEGGWIHQRQCSNGKNCIRTVSIS